ncbi:hypothetical protein LVJ94_34340 [Pendulispora rubella]|uniref:Acetate CoA-transferase n=1 Tax=Pendulispora rubella TaxID=2741070 RepID=A0ABZ2KTF8_9BACT
MNTRSSLPQIHADVDAMVQAHVKPGMHLHLATNPSRPNALIHALARNFRHKNPRFTISTTALQGSGHALALAGVIERAITCFAGDNYPSPRPNRIYQNLLAGKPFVLEQWSILSLVQRLMAAALGSQYAVTRSLVGSDLERAKEDVLFTIPDPAQPSESITLLRSLAPDLTLVHGVCADDRGNVLLCAPTGEGHWGALAARGGVIASVERIVPRAVIDAHADRVLVPGHRVVGLCEARFGAHPQSLRTCGIGDIPSYRDDYAALLEIVERFRTAPDAEAWFRDWVAPPRGHDAYLAHLGEERLHALSAVPERKAAPAPQGEPTVAERLIALAARQIVDLVLERDYQTILAGIGISHIAAWVAAKQLERRGVHVRLLAELGFYGMDPHPGDVYLFSQLHMGHCEQLAGVAEILGCYVAGQASKCLGVLGAGEIDPKGNINSTRTNTGKYIIGSGGANDIASTVDCLLVAREGKNRLVREVAYTTSPGRNVLGVVTPFGRFGRTTPEEPLSLSTWLPVGSEGEATPSASVERWSDWPLPVESVSTEADIRDDERALIWEIDAEGVYRR